MEVLKEENIGDLVFSSSCTVYGEPDEIPVKESTQTKMAESPYGATKQMGEIILKDNANWLNTQCLRYFNPIGAHESGFIGELPIGVPNNLIPYLTQTVAGIRKELTVFGDDYNTTDGTCIRDYKQNESFEVVYTGTGNGSIVLEVIQAFETANGISVPHKIGSRRAGDVIQVWAETTKVENVLGWKAKRDLETMLKDAWNWQTKLS